MGRRPRRRCSSLPRAPRHHPCRLGRLRAAARARCRHRPPPARRPSLHAALFAAAVTRRCRRPRHRHSLRRRRRARLRPPRIRRLSRTATPRRAVARMGVGRGDGTRARLYGSRPRGGMHSLVGAVARSARGARRCAPECSSGSSTSSPPPSTRRRRAPPLALTAANVPAAPRRRRRLSRRAFGLGLAAAALLAERDWRPTVAPCVTIALTLQDAQPRRGAAAAGVAWGPRRRRGRSILLLVLGGACVPRRSHARLHRALFIAELAAAAGAVGLGFGSGVWAGIGVAPPSASRAWPGARAAHERVPSLPRAAPSFPCSSSPRRRRAEPRRTLGSSPPPRSPSPPPPASRRRSSPRPPRPPSALPASFFARSAALAVDLRALPERRLAAIASHVDASLVLAAFSAARRAHDAHALSAPTKGSSTFKTARGGSVMHGGGDAGGEWTEEYDEKSGARYYFQPTTGASQWEPPQLTTTRSASRAAIAADDDDEAAALASARQRRRRAEGARHARPAAAAARGGTCSTNRGGGGGRDGRLRTAQRFGAHVIGFLLLELGAAASCARARRARWSLAPLGAAPEGLAPLGELLRRGEAEEERPLRRREAGRRGGQRATRRRAAARLGPRSRADGAAVAAKRRREARAGEIERRGGNHAALRETEAASRGLRVIWSEERDAAALPPAPAWLGEDADDEASAAAKAAAEVASLVAALEAAETRLLRRQQKAYDDHIERLRDALAAAACSSLVEASEMSGRAASPATVHLEELRPEEVVDAMFGRASVGTNSRASEEERDSLPPAGEVCLREPTPKELVERLVKPVKTRLPPGEQWPDAPFPPSVGTIGAVVPSRADGGGGERASAGGGAAEGWSGRAAAVDRWGSRAALTACCRGGSATAGSCQRSRWWRVTGGCSIRSSCRVTPTRRQCTACASAATAAGCPCSSTTGSPSPTTTTATSSSRAASRMSSGCRCSRRRLQNCTARTRRSRAAGCTTLSST